MGKVARRANDAFLLLPCCCARVFIAPLLQRTYLLECFSGMSLRPLLPSAFFVCDPGSAAVVTGEAHAAFDADY